MLEKETVFEYLDTILWMIRFVGKTYGSVAQFQIESLLSQNVLWFSLFSFSSLWQIIVWRATHKIFVEILEKLKTRFNELFPIKIVENVLLQFIRIWQFWLFNIWMFPKSVCYQRIEVVTKETYYLHKGCIFCRNVCSLKSKQIHFWTIYAISIRLKLFNQRQLTTKTYNW